MSSPGLQKVLEERFEALDLDRSSADHQAFVHSFAKANPKAIVIVARSSSALEEVRDEIHAINKDIQVLIVPTDLLIAESIAAMWAKVKETYGHADVLISNAGTCQTGPISDIPVEKWWINFVSFMISFAMSDTHHCRKRMYERHSCSPRALQNCLARKGKAASSTSFRLLLS